MKPRDIRTAAIGRALLPNVWDVAALILVIGAMVLIVYGGKQTVAPLSELERTPVSLDPANLPLYALRTTLRMLLAMVCSTVFTFVYAAIAAKSRRAELVMIPLLDILQSVPILGFLTFTVVFFMNLFPGQVLGAELASVFAIFTSQAWNMTFSMYQSMRNVPKDLEEATQSFHLSGWQRFWRLDVPFAMPGLIWNAMMSMSGGWFFVVASEAITVGTTTVTLPGIGSYVALAIQQQDLPAILYAMLAMLFVIIAYDQLLFRPIVAWADKFRFEQTASGEAPTSWMLDLFRRTRALRALTLPFAALSRAISNLRIPLPKLPPAAAGKGQPSRLVDTVWIALILAGTAYAASLTYRYLSASLGMSDVLVVIRDGLITLLRVAVLISLATLVWVPVGVWIGLRPKLAERIQPLAQFLAAFPANLAFPVFVLAIVHFKLAANIWLSPLMILGTQWYILFNVIAGASAFPSDLREAASSFHLGGWRWWFKAILPGIFPYYVTGAITASGGSWNASIVAEVASWGDTHLKATGLGAYIASATEAGDFPRVVLGIATMCILVTLFNRLVWRPLYAFGERRLRLG
ncbi:NitT/TauT family transport system permease protein [Bradyrhizobium japonicum]|uniref:ABC transporter permease n=1 Tax=Bradyrhizobium japonicum TaxID=375 RepID=UPI001BA89834|nr:ABC transporter permease subunit [Bradyrhizobium japonicum]MBR0731871.1 ABC transporter permease subunit [Bradyrhizobium japonicum]MBR0804640.1 ABC transporter permease subunit [Bradyrhizobium japonicum]MCS3498851.1 NitT/TauT family transport system permease protein [Bradyrhizobium japonicum]MCS3958986.1 NitT/TauT family transport system permease protein [Bradyrhizobium japonicum]MCS4000741.1 NitT/TauT family transport system permease protein [Bradyrhizobium japonicum]